MLCLNYLEKSAEVCKENFENQSHVLLFLGRRRIAVNNGVDFGATLASAQISMRSKPLTQSNGVVVRKSSIRKLPIVSFRGQKEPGPPPDRSPLAVKFKISDEHPHPFHMRSPPPLGETYFNIIKGSKISLSANAASLQQFQGVKQYNIHFLRLHETFFPQVKKTLIL